MKKFYLIIIPLLYILNSFGQNFYTPKYKITTKDDSIYLNLIKDNEKLDNELYQMLDSILYKKNEIESINNFIMGIKAGLEDYVSNSIQIDSIIKKLIIRNNLSPAKIFELTKKYKAINNHKDWYYDISICERIFDSQKKIPRYELKEFKKYNIENGDKILEIGSGFSNFAFIIGKKRKNCDIYLNDINDFALKNLYLKLNVENSIYKKNAIKNNNRYFLIQGSDTSTNVENIIFDKIILRNAFHCFTDKVQMLNSIKKSMDKNTILLIKDNIIQREEDVTIKDKYYNNNEKDLHNPKVDKHYMLRSEFEKIMKENSFTQISKQKIKDKDIRNFWLYKFKL